VEFIDLIRTDNKILLDGAMGTELDKRGLMSQSQKWGTLLGN